jgi:hypothetical protein
MEKGAAEFGVPATRRRSARPHTPSRLLIRRSFGRGRGLSAGLNLHCLRPRGSARRDARAQEHSGRNSNLPINVR